MNQDLFFPFWTSPYWHLQFTQRWEKSLKTCKTLKSVCLIRISRKKKYFYSVGVYITEQYSRCCVISDNESQKITVHSAGLRLFVSNIYKQYNVLFNWPVLFLAIAPSIHQSRFRVTVITALCKFSARVMLSHNNNNKFNTYIAQNSS